MINRINDPIFRGLIVMNAVEQFLEIFAEHPDALNPGDWQENWSNYFSEKGIADLPEKSDEDEKREWIENTVKSMAEMFKLRSKVLDSEATGKGS